jgi:hypothetical protein
VLALALVLSLALVTTAVAAPTPAPNTSTAERSTAAARFHQDIQPILSRYCYDCHADGMNKGKVAFDEFKDNQDLMGRTELWLAVLKNVRAGIMPPAKKPRPTPEELQRLERWIKHDSFAIDPDNPDPGRVTIRRLNRIEYRNTVRDLTGYDFNVDEELPPDDTGYGFDTIGDVLTVSPMLLEKYMQAAEAIAAGAVPRQARVIRQKTLAFSQFRFTNPEATNEPAGDRLSFYKPAQLEHHFDADLPGTYRVRFNFEIAGMFDFDPGRCRVIVRVDDQEALQEEFAWQNHKKVPLEFERRWDPGQRRLALELVPLTPIEQKKNSLDLRLASVRIDGPIEQQHWVRPKHFESFFWQDPPARPADRRRYTREVLQRFATRAYRRPVDERTLDRLVTIALETAETAGKTFEDGIAQALVPVLASPRFLMRIEGDLPGARFPLIDEYALASRLSYFLWSTMPDPALFQLAEQGALRRNLAPQVERMLADPRSNELIAHFVGQWLQVRDLDGIDINARAVLARDSGAEREMQLARARLQELQAKAELTPEEKQERDKLFEQRRQRFRMPVPELDRELRRAMRQETEMLFAHVLRNNRSLVELIDSDYTFLNARLAKHYGITNVSGAEMRQVALPAGHARGGLLTQGSTLIVTSNPTRTSPVKRGLFLLDNILGTPPPPRYPLARRIRKRIQRPRPHPARNPSRAPRETPLRFLPQSHGSAGARSRELQRSRHVARKRTWSAHRRQRYTHLRREFHLDPGIEAHPRQSTPARLLPLPNGKTPDLRARARHRVLRRRNRGPHRGAVGP